MEEKTKDPKRPERNKQILDVMKAERSRGKKGPIAAAAQAEQARIRKVVEKLLSRATEREVHETLNSLEPKLDAATFANALRIWRENRRS